MAPGGGGGGGGRTFLGGSNGAGGGGGGGSGYTGGTSTYVVSNITASNGSSTGGAAAGATGAAGSASFTGPGLTQIYTPAVAVTDNAPVQAGSTLTFTATVTGPSGDPTPTGTMNWAITPPSGSALVLLHDRSDWFVERGDVHLLDHECHRRHLQRHGELPRRLQLHSCFGVGHHGDRLHAADLRRRGNGATWTTSGAKTVAYPSWCC